VRSHLADRVVHGVPEIDAVAQAMGTSVRSPQRLLGRSATSYKQLLDLVRRELAQRHVHDASLSLIDVALILGSSDQTAFQRAFRRSFKQTPGAMRRAQLERGG